MQPQVIKGDPKSVTIGAPQLDSFQDYQDASWDQSQRYLAPQQTAQNKQFQQMMVNKGLAPGSDAYKAEYDNMMRSQNDANTAASFGAMQFGLGAQNQAYTQGLGASQLASAMKQAQMQDATSRYGIKTNADIAREQMSQQGQQFNQGMDLQRDQFGFDQSKWGDQFGLQRDQFGFQQDQADFGNMMQLGNFGMQLGDYANRAAMSDYNMASAMLGYAPGNQSQQIDVSGAYNTAQQGALAQDQMCQPSRPLPSTGRHHCKKEPSDCRSRGLPS